MAPSSQPDGTQDQDLANALNLLRATLDSSMDMIQVCDAVYDEQRKIIDFVWILNNMLPKKIMEM